MIGILVDDADLKAAEEYSTTHSDTKLFKLPQITCLKGTFPYKNQLSYMIYPAKVYSAIIHYINKNQPEINQQAEICAVETCPNHQDKNQLIEVNYIYGNQIKDYLLHKAPAPEKKSKPKKC